MSAPIVVTGATGRLGQLVTVRLLDANQRVRVFTRRPDVARTLFGARVEIAQGDFADTASLHAALAGTRKLFLLSPISETLAQEQIAAASVAAIEGGARIVKISGSDWTINPAGVSISGDAHAAVERHLSSLNIEHVAIRPNAWMQIALLNTLRQAIRDQVVITRLGSARVAYIDARDIADVAVHQLLAPRVSDTPLVITGAQAVSARDIAAILAPVLHRPIGVSEAAAGTGPQPGDSFEHRAVAQFGGLIAAGKASTVTRVFTDLLGRAPRSVQAFIGEQVSAVAALAS